MIVSLCGAERFVNPFTSPAIDKSLWNVPTPTNVEIPATKRLVGLIEAGDETPLLPMYL